MANERTTLTKSLHTVTAVSRLAHYLLTVKPLDEIDPAKARAKAISVALALLGQRTDWEPQDPTLMACDERLAVLVSKSARR